MKNVLSFSNVMPLLLIDASTYTAEFETEQVILLYIWRLVTLVYIIKEAVNRGT